MLKSYYDQQVEEKKKRSQVEKDMDKAQANIWIQDEKNYKEHNQKVNTIIRNMHKKNLDTLKTQIENKKNKQNNTRMTQQEKAMNKD